MPCSRSCCGADTLNLTQAPALPRTGCTDLPIRAYPQLTRQIAPLRYGRVSGGRRMFGSYQIGGDHGLLERRTTAPARQRAGAEEDRRGLARADGRRYREGYELGNALLLVHEGGRREALAPKAARANRRRSRVYWRIDRTVRRHGDMNR